MSTLDAIRHSLESLAARAETAGDALDGARLDLADGTLVKQHPGCRTWVHRIRLGY
jgi:hypothetical protein